MILRLSTLKLIYDILDDKIRNWRGLRLSDNYHNHTRVRNELEEIIRVAEERSRSLRKLRKNTLDSLPVRVPCDIEVD